MKTLLAALVLLCASLVADADTITTGNLSFTCSGTNCNGSPLPGTPPDSGSFVYDNTTNQFVSMMVSWDGLSLVLVPPEFTIPPINQEAVYLGLIGEGSPEFWIAICSQEVEAPSAGCGDDFGFEVGALVLYPAVPFPLLMPEMPNNFAAGTVVATDQVTSTPEPSTLALLLMGLALSWGLARRVQLMEGSATPNRLRRPQTRAQTIVEDLKSAATENATTA